MRLLFPTPPSPRTRIFINEDGSVCYGGRFVCGIEKRRKRLEKAYLREITKELSRTNPQALRNPPTSPTPHSSATKAESTFPQSSQRSPQSHSAPHSNSPPSPRSAFVPTSTNTASGVWDLADFSHFRMWEKDDRSEMLYVNRIPCDFR